MMKNILLTVLSFIFLGTINIYSQACLNDTIFSDVIFIVDNSGSIDDAEFAAFGAIIQASVNKVQTNCAEAQIAIVHYGGSFGKGTSVEYPLSNTNNVSSINRQFCTTRNPSTMFCDDGGGDDLNAAMDSIITYIGDGTLAHNTDNNLHIVIFTDAFDGASTCTQPFCSVLRPFTNISTLKTTYSADVTVVGASMQANAALLQIYASPGGTYNDTALDPDCATSVDGCAQPRKYVPIEFNSDVNTTSDIIAANVSCQVQIATGLLAEAGPDQIVCGDLSGMATLTASAIMGTEPYNYLWGGASGSGATFAVTPSVTTTYYVTATDANNCTSVDSVTVMVENCCATFAVDAGLDRDVCVDMSGSAILTASASGGMASYTYTWDNGLGAGQSHTVTPSVTTTYTVTATDNNGCVTTDQVTISAVTCGPSCDPDTTFTDVIFLIDNSGSINDSEFTTFENIILESLNGIRTSCASSNRAVVHYGGANGTSTIVEYALGQVSQITDINRQYCTARTSGGICIGGGGDDLNNAIGDIMTFLGNGTLNRDPNNKLALVIFTDAFGFDTTCPQPNCSLILPTTNIDMMKSTYGVDVSVVGMSSQAEEVLLGIYASPGGSFNSPLFAAECAGSFDGCQLPRKYIQVEFNTPPTDVSNMIASFVECTVDITPALVVDAGADQTICTNFGQSATLTANVAPSSGVPPFMYQWSDGLGTMQSVDVMPLMTQTYYVTATDANMCISEDSVTVNGIICDVCNADAGDPLPPNEVCLEDGQARLPSDSNIGVVLPMGFEEIFLLTNSDLVIIDYSIGFKNFVVNEEGLYRIHTLVAEVTNPASEDYLDLNIIKPGSSGLFIIANCINDHGICADLDFPGRVHQVFGPADMMCMTFENSINLCMDGIDNDGDGLVDCADEECKELINCEESTLIACNDLTDNDGDGLVDCFDPDCFGFTVCFERGANCNDGIDNDGDGLIDCADNSCDGAAPCVEDSPFTCIDGRDNDGDGLIDCQEPDCQRFIVCAEYSEAACTDGKDNDFDGLVDCADSGCKDILGEVCNPEETTLAKCSDGEDNDGDGLVDCADPDCRMEDLVAIEDNIELVIEVTNATCPDNDNGAIRLVGIAQNPNFQYSIDGGENFLSSFQFTGLDVGEYDVVIRSAMGCLLHIDVDVSGQACIEICNNGIDDDNDGLVDCADSQCNNPDPHTPQIINIVGADCPTFSNGSFAIAGLPGGVLYSIDGTNYQSLPKFSSLTDGTYNLSYKDEFGCYQGLQVIIPQSSKVCIPEEICDNGIDDDQDGLTDCMDGDDCPSQDTDGDGVCNFMDRCPNFDDALIGSPCDDGSDCTDSDTIREDCNCRGDIIDSDGDGICDIDDPCPMVIGTDCPEICNNGLDDDGDGLIDCADTQDCAFNGQSVIDFKSTLLNGKDGYVINMPGATSTNFSNESFLISQEGLVNVGAPYHGHTFIDFPISQIFDESNIMIQESRITLYSDPQADQVGNNASLIHLLAAPWEEASLTYDTRPEFNPDHFIVVPRSNNFQSIEIDVKPLLEKVIEEGLTFYGFIVQPREKTPTRSMVFASSEHPDQTRTPEIYVSYTSNCLYDEICNNNIDDDGDGLVDCADSECGSTIAIVQNPGDSSENDVRVEVINATCPTNSNGAIVIDSEDQSLEYSIDNISYGSFPGFSNLTPDQYNLYVRSTNGCISSAPLSITGMSCILAEVCGNGVDDDGDGLVDCEDRDCGLEDLVVTATAGNCENNVLGKIEVSNQSDQVEYQYTLESYSTSLEVSGVSFGTYNGFYENIGIMVNGCLCYEKVDEDLSLAIQIDTFLINEIGELADPTYFLQFKPVTCSEYTSWIGGLQLTSGGTSPLGCDFTQISISNDISISEIISDQTVISTSQQTIPLFNNLTKGLYQLTVATENGCEYSEQIVIEVDECVQTEVCSNAIDDDGDGLIDCDDSDCAVDCDSSNVERKWWMLTRPNNGSTGIFKVVLYNEQTNEIEHEIPLPSSYGSPHALDFYDNALWIGGAGSNDHIYKLDPNNGSVLDSIVKTRQDPGGQVNLLKTEGMEVVEDGIWIESFSNIAKLDFDGNTILQYPTPQTVVQDIALEGDWMYYVVNGAEDPIRRVNINDGTEEYVVETGISTLYTLTLETNNFVLITGSNEIRRIDRNNLSLVSDTPTNVEGWITAIRPYDTQVSSGSQAFQTVSLNLNVMLQGACSPDGGGMKTELNDGGYLPGQKPATYFGVATPPGQPFDQAPWFYQGYEGKDMKSSNKSDEPVYNSDVVDWILVSLRTEPSKSSEVWKGAALLYNDGSIQFFNPVALQQFREEGYHVVIEHRNHLPVMSHKKVKIIDGQITYDFTKQDSYRSIIGIGQIPDDYRNYMMVAGNGELIVELSSDIDINARDLTLWLQNNGANSSYFLEDYDMNGDINIKDRILWEKNNGLFTTLQTK